MSKIKNIYSYNEAVSRSQVISYYGPGALKHTTWGVIMPQNIEAWESIKTLNRLIDQLSGNSPEERLKELNSMTKAIDPGLTVSNDTRFIQFLKYSKGYQRLEFLMAIPSVELTNGNYFPFDNPSARDTLPVTAVHFPKYMYDPDFRNKDPELKEYRQWISAFTEDFLENSRETKPHKIKSWFAPPKSYKPTALREYGTPEKEASMRRLLVPVPLILICPHGHITDIPWTKYVQTFGKRHEEGLRAQMAEHLFHQQDCCGAPSLIWEGGNLSAEGFEGINIYCKNCSSRANLRYISQLNTLCNGHRPWEHNGHHNQCNERMQYALTTGNNLYYPQSVGCLYMPLSLLEGVVDQDKLYQIEQLFSDSPYEAKADFIREMGWLLKSKFKDAVELQKLIDAFQNLEDIQHQNLAATTDTLRYQEYQVFSQNPTGYRNEKDPGLAFSPVALPAFQDGYFSIQKKLSLIQKVETLKVTRAQLSFTRIYPMDIDTIDDASPDVRPQRIHSLNKEFVKVLPVVESFGEGIFFGFDLSKIIKWESKLKDTAFGKQIEHRIQELQNDTNPFTRDLNRRFDLRFLLIHTMSHLLMKELEFKCGYAAASLSERIYVGRSEDELGENMAGFLIYTTEGNQGSMGGLTFQARTLFLERLLEDALFKAEDCGSDPICWHSEGQGMGNTNFAACFSCAMVSETSCEWGNMILDRRALVDPEFGFFKMQL